MCIFKKLKSVKQNHRDNIRLENDMMEVFGHLLFLDLSFFQNYTYINYREMAGAKYVLWRFV